MFATVLEKLSQSGFRGSAFGFFSGDIVLKQDFLRLLQFLAIDDVGDFGAVDRMNQRKFSGQSFGFFRLDSADEMPAQIQCEQLILLFKSFLQIIFGEVS